MTFLAAGHIIQTTHSAPNFEPVSTSLNRQKCDNQDCQIRPVLLPIGKTWELDELNQLEVSHRVNDDATFVQVQKKNEKQKLNCLRKKSLITSHSSIVCSKFWTNEFVTLIYAISFLHCAFYELGSLCFFVRCKKLQDFLNQVLFYFL